MLVTTTRRASRVSLLAGAATAVALFLTISPASAQSGASATGGRTLTNAQALQGSDQIAGAETTTIASASPTTTDASVRLDDNGIVTSARGNQGNGTLASDSLDSFYPGVTDLRAGPRGVSANGALVISNRQAVSNSNTSTVAYGSLITLSGGQVDGSSLSASGNTQDATATANGASDDVAVANGGAGAGIASFQTMNSGSQSSGRANSTIGVKATTLSTSSIANTGNVLRGVGTGNDITATVSARIGTVDASLPPLTGPVAMLAANDDPSVTAHYGILTNQSASGLVKGRAGSSDDGPAFHVGLSNVVVGSTIANDGNSLIAASYDNSADNSLGIDATSVVAAPGTTVGDITDAQSVGGRANAFTWGGSAIDLGFGMVNSSVSASNNTARAVAAGNLASDAMTVKAISVSTDLAGSANALTTGDGGATHNAAFGVQTVQDFGTSNITASQIHGTTLVNVAGPVVSSAVSADKNLRAAAASGNSAVSSLDLTGDALNSTAAVNLVQSGNGSVTASLGSTIDIAGTRVSATHISDSAVSVTGNSDTATALGNDGSASLSVTANRVASTSGLASAGLVDAAYGASGGYVLATSQKLGAPDLAGGLLPMLNSTVVDRSGLAVSGDVGGSSLSIDDNAQRANALGNSGINRVDVTANALEGTATSALSSSQYGQATIAATSSQYLTVPGTLATSSASLSGNSNIAYAVVNNVDNGLTVKGQGVAGGAASALSSDEMGPPLAAGEDVLANQQFAMGTLDASASSKLGNTGATDRLNASTLTMSGNSVLADASANHALNSVSLDGGSVGGLVNTQASVAAVHAVAASDLRFTASGTQSSLQGSALTFDGNTIGATARGNAADNALTYIGGASDLGGAADAQASAFTASGDAPLAVLNSQANMAAVIAETRISGISAPLNGAMTGSQLSVSGNTMSATAYGNSATNVMTVSSVGAAAAASLVNMQTNSGSVGAIVSGATYRSLIRPVSGSSVGISGNQLGASATGNLAVSSITAGH